MPIPTTRWNRTPARDENPHLSAAACPSLPGRCRRQSRSICAELRCSMGNFAGQLFDNFRGNNRESSPATIPLFLSYIKSKLTDVVVHNFLHTLGRGYVIRQLPQNLNHLRLKPSHIRVCSAMFHWPAELILILQIMLKNGVLFKKD
jgi:hypothetical protein